MGFQDESGISDKPFVRKTWALKGNTPHIQSCGGWKKLTLSGIIITNPKNLRSKLFLRILAGTMTGENFLRFLKELKIHTKKKKLMLFVDGLPSHRSKKVKEYINQENSWLRVERLPGYAPELNPIEYLWASMKKRHLGNARTENMKELATMVRKAKRKMNDTKLLEGFLKASNLFG
jgi:transposase